METLIIVVLVIIAAIATLWWRRRGQTQEDEFGTGGAHLHRNDGYQRRGEGGGGSG